MTRSHLMVTALVLAVAIVAGAAWSHRSGEPAPTEDLMSPAVLTPQDLWVLSVGVSRYRDSSLTLHFAEHDARAVADVLTAQGGSSLYRQVNTLVLADAEVTRESLLRAASDFLGRAGPNDVVVIFLAGHGIQEPSTGSYYFLPHDAGPTDFVTSGVRMSDLNESLRALRHNVRRVVVLLDTCNAGAGQLAVGSPYGAADSWSADSFDGFFLLAGARATEASKELPQIEHGAFTWALLEGLRGAADPDGDGEMSVADLFALVAREVPRLTGERQHPYQRIEGSDSPFAVVVRAAMTPRPRPPEASQSSIAASATQAPARSSIAVVRFDNLRGDPQHDWIGMALLAAFNTELTRNGGVEVYAPELIGSSRAMRADDLTAARRLGIAKVLAGTYAVFGDSIRIDARVVDSSTGMQEASTSAEGPLSDFFALQRRIIDELHHAYPATSATERPTAAVIAVEQPLNAYKLLLQAEGLTNATPDAEPDSKQPTMEPHSFLWRVLASVARAQLTASVDRATVEALLDRYRIALEHADDAAYAHVYVSFSLAQRAAIRAYFENAQQLRVRISDIEITTNETGPVVSFVRHDAFLDRESGRSAELEVRLVKQLVRSQDGWRFAAPGP